LGGWTTGKIPPMSDKTSPPELFPEDLARTDYRKLRRLEKQLQAKLYIEQQRPVVLAQIAEFEALLAERHTTLEEAKSP
jgi:hypothetical protein